MGDKTVGAKPIKKINKEYTVLFDRGTPVKRGNIVGYCGNATHWGWINNHLLLSHRCLEKKCRYFQKANPEYWDKIEAKRQIAKSKRDYRKNVEAKEAERKKHIKSVLRPYTNVYVTSVRETNKGLMITYIYDEYVDLSHAIDILREHYNCGIYLKAVKSSLENRIALIRNRKNTDLLSIPGIGNVTKQRLENVGYHFVEDLEGANPETIYFDDCQAQGKTVNRRMLYLYKKAVGYAEQAKIQRGMNIAAKGRTVAGDMHNKSDDERLLEEPINHMPISNTEININSALMDQLEVLFSNK